MTEDGSQGRAPMLQPLPAHPALSAQPILAGAAPAREAPAPTPSQQPVCGCMAAGLPVEMDPAAQQQQQAADVASPVPLTTPLGGAGQASRSQGRSDAAGEALPPAAALEASPVPAPAPADAVTPGSPTQLKGKAFGTHRGESEAAEVLALLAGDTPSSSGGPTAFAPPTAGPAPPGGAPQTIRASRRMPGSAELSPHGATPQSATQPAAKAYSLNSRVGQATVSIVDYIRRNQDAYLKTTGTGVPERMLRNAFGNNPDTSKALRFLVAENRIVRSGAGGRKDPYSYVLAANADAPLPLAGPSGASRGRGTAAAAAASGQAGSQQGGGVLSQQGSGNVSARSDQQPRPTPVPLRGATKRKPQRPSAAAGALPHQQYAQQQWQEPAAEQTSGGAAAGVASGGAAGPEASSRRQRRPSTKAQENADAEQLLEALEGSGAMGGSGGRATRRRRVAPALAAPASMRPAPSSSSLLEAEASSTQLEEDGGEAGRQSKRTRVGSGSSAFLTPSPHQGTAPPPHLTPAAATAAAAGMVPLVAAPAGMLVPAMVPPGMVAGCVPLLPAAPGAAAAAATVSPQAAMLMQMQAAQAAQFAYMQQMQWMYLQQQQQQQQQAHAQQQSPAAVSETQQLQQMQLQQNAVEQTPEPQLAAPGIEQQQKQQAQQTFMQQHQLQQLKDEQSGGPL